MGRSGFDNSIPLKCWSCQILSLENSHSVPFVVTELCEAPTLPGQMELAKVFAVNMTLVHKRLLLRFCGNLKKTTMQWKHRRAAGRHRHLASLH